MADADFGMSLRLEGLGKFLELSDSRNEMKEALCILCLLIN